MEGGSPGGLGRNTWIKQPREEDGDLPEDSSNPSTALREINIGGKATLFMGKGDRLLIETPGGGAWGASEDDAKDYEQQYVKAWEPRGSLAERTAAQAAF
jgi:5-oxoprolinase (ATP-hydrolysing)